MMCDSLISIKISQIMLTQKAKPMLSNNIAIIKINISKGFYGVKSPKAIVVVLSIEKYKLYSY